MNDKPNRDRINAITAEICKDAAGTIDALYELVEVLAPGKRITKAERAVISGFTTALVSHISELTAMLKGTNETLNLQMDLVAQLKKAIALHEEHVKVQQQLIDELRRH